jgi:hypothetical protein
MRSGLISFAAFALASLGSLAADAGPRAVVELFTSQGCSSCPPADRVLNELSREPDLVALSLPVDYWDYLGWKDTLASPAFSARQRAYAAARGDQQVFTPQMVINGTAFCIGSDRAKLGDSIARAARGRDTLPVPITVGEEGSNVAISVGRADAMPSGEVWLFPVAKTRQVSIGRGENRGRSIAYANVVRGMTRVGSWSGSPARFEVPLSIARGNGADSYVILLQSGEIGKPGLILGAAKGPGL